MPHPSLSRQFRTDDHDLCYHHLAHPVFSDTIFASIVSRRGNMSMQGYATDFDWSKAFPMSSSNEAHGTLSLMIARDGVLHTCICDSVKEMIKGNFPQKFKDAAYHQKQLEQFTSLLNAAEREIKERGWS